jgi:hypothetical protein
MKCEEEKCSNLSRDGIQEGFAQKLTMKSGSSKEKQIL